MSNQKEILNLLIETREKAYAPYSNFKVGAVLTTKEGKIYTGCNIENDGIMSICAERVAFVKAISEGEREFESIYVLGDKEQTTPCGYCRQFMSEFVKPDFKIYIGNQNKETFTEYTIREMLPFNFGLK